MTRRRWRTPGAYPDLHYADGVMEAAEGASVVLLLTEWDQFSTTEQLASVAAGRVIVDGRHALDAEAWRAAGWSTARSAGASSSAPPKVSQVERGPSADRSRHR